MSLLATILSSVQTGDSTYTHAPAAPLFIFSGESNSGGYANNSLALSSELGDRPTVKILNNTTLASFDTLHISSIGDGADNTHTGHVGTELWGSVHGWELELANRVAAGTFGTNPCYLVKTGQGGSRISDWIGGTLYTYNGSSNYVDPWAAFQQRVNAALSILQSIDGNSTRNIYMFYSQGINDALNATAIASWKQYTKDHIAKIRAKYGQVKVVTHRFETITSVNMAAYNTAIDEICAEVTDITAVSTSSATLKDNYHWNYTGMKLIADRMMDALLVKYGAQ